MFDGWPRPSVRAPAAGAGRARLADREQHLRLLYRSGRGRFDHRHAIQIARWLGSEIGSAVIQTFVRVREQVYSNLIGLHVVTGLPATAQVTAQLAGPFGNRATGIGEPAAQGTAVLASIVRREAYVLAYLDAFWLIAWVSLLGILLVLLLRPPPPNPLIPSRGAS